MMRAAMQYQTVRATYNISSPFSQVLNFGLLVFKEEEKD